MTSQETKSDGAVVLSTAQLGRVLINGHPYMRPVMRVAAIRLGGGPACVVRAGDLMAMIADGHEYTVQVKTMRVAEFERMDEFTGW
jgi:hypothetical protein